MLVKLLGIGRSKKKEMYIARDIKILYFFKLLNLIKIIQLNAIEPLL